MHSGSARRGKAGFRANVTIAASTDGLSRFIYTAVFSPAPEIASGFFGYSSMDGGAVLADSCTGDLCTG